MRQHARQPAESPVSTMLLAVSAMLLTVFTFLGLTFMREQQFRELLNDVLERVRDMRRPELRLWLKELRERLERLNVKITACEIALARKDRRAEYRKNDNVIQSSKSKQT